MGSRLFWFTTNHRLLETMILLMTHHYKSDSVLQPNKGGTNITLVCGLIKVKFITDWRLLSVTPANATVYNLHTHLEVEQVLIHYRALCSLRNFKVFVLILYFFLICKMLHSVWSVTHLLLVSALCLSHLVSHKYTSITVEITSFTDVYVTTPILDCELWLAAGALTFKSKIQVEGVFHLSSKWELIFTYTYLGMQHNQDAHIVVDVMFQSFVISDDSCYFIIHFITNYIFRHWNVWNK